MTIIEHGWLTIITRGSHRTYAYWTDDEGGRMAAWRLAETWLAMPYSTVLGAIVTIEPAAIMVGGDA